MTMIIVNSEKMIEREIASAPAFMLPREYTENGLENAVKGVSPLVRWDVVEVGGVKKLAVIDNGRGMTPTEIETFTTTIGASMGNKDGSKNHGVGARYSGLHSSPTGLVYYTKTKGGPIYTFTLAMTEKGPDCIVKPKIVNSAPFKIGEHGTIVVFLGESKSQDTSKEVYRDNKKPTRNKLQRTLAERYFRLPKGSRVEFAEEISAHGKDGVKMVTLSEYMPRVAKYAAVKHEDLTIHYALFPNKKDLRQTLSGITFAGLGGVVWDNEVYQLEDRQDWLRTAASFRIEAIQERVWIFVEMHQLSKDVMASTHRDQLIWTKPQDREGYEAHRARHVRVKNFRLEIARTMPTWMAEAAKQEEIKEDERALRDARKELLDRMRDMKATMSGLVKDQDGEETGQEGAGLEITEHKTDKPIGPNAKSNVIPFPKGDPASKKETIANLPNVEVVMLDFETPVSFNKSQEVDGLYTMVLYSNNSKVAPVYAETRKMADHLTEQEFVEWWRTTAQHVAVTTFGMHYVAAVIVDGMGDKEEAKRMLEIPGAKSAISHLFDFKQGMRKAAVALAKRKVG